MSLATKIAAGLCICPVVAAPPALMHKPTRDKIARAAGYVPKAQKPATPISMQPEVACAEPSIPGAPAVALGPLATPGPLVLNQLPFRPSGPGGLPFPGPGGGGGGPGFVPEVPTEPGGGEIPGIPEPATWTIMVVGFGMVGAAVRRGHRTSPSPAASSRKEANS